jgi:Uma2 family endonuclease
MTAIPKNKMSVPEFLTWADALPGDSRYELDRGVPVAMAPGNVQHVRMIGRVYTGLSAAIGQLGLPCEAFLDGPGVIADEMTYYIPDVSVNCGERVPDETGFLPNPVIVLEVLSPSTKRLDKHAKLRGYFRVPSIQHYVVVDIAERVVFHHKRADGDLILTAILREGELALNPPGLALPLSDMFG